MDSPKMSLLMPVYNSYASTRSSKNFLPQAIRTILRQTFTDFELIILDNQSTDDTSKFCQQAARQDSRIRYIRDTEQRFPEAAIGHLAGMARGDYCAIANDDDLWDREYFEKLFDYAESHPETNLVYGREIAIDER